MGETRPRDRPASTVRWGRDASTYHSHEDGAGADDAVLFTLQDPRATSHRACPRDPCTGDSARKPQNTRGRTAAGQRRRRFGVRQSGRWPRSIGSRNLLPRTAARPRVSQFLLKPMGAPDLCVCRAGRRARPHRRQRGSMPCSRRPASLRPLIAATRRRRSGAKLRPGAPEQVGFAGAATPRRGTPRRRSSGCVRGR
jgi:hypothetical protein